MRTKGCLWDVLAYFIFMKDSENVRAHQLGKQWEPFCMRKHVDKEGLDVNLAAIHLCVNNRILLLKSFIFPHIKI